MKQNSGIAEQGNLKLLRRQFTFTFSVQLCYSEDTLWLLVTFKIVVFYCIQELDDLQTKLAHISNETDTTLVQCPKASLKLLAFYLLYLFLFLQILTKGFLFLFWDDNYLWNLLVQGTPFIFPRNWKINQCVDLGYGFYLIKMFFQSSGLENKLELDVGNY